jgi:drug/metabolite transporter (DMT)-like permease
LHTLGVVVGMLGVYFVVPFGQDDDPLPLGVAIVLSVGVVLVLTAMVSRRIVRVLEGSSSEGLPGLLTVLVLVVVGFSAVYFLLARAEPDQVAGLDTRLDALYFTLSTTVTVGYGDIHPAGQAARGIACVQFAFNAILVTGLVRAIFYQAQARKAGG